MKKVSCILAIALLVILPACSFGKCNVTGYKEDVQPIINEWEDAFNLAASSPRYALPDRIETLQDIKRETENTEIDECVADAHHRLVNSMKYAIQGFLSFLAEEPDEYVDLAFGESTNFMEAYRIALEDIQNQK